jgi:hypothetical protein
MTVKRLAAGRPAAVRTRTAVAAAITVAVVTATAAGCASTASGNAGGPASGTTSGTTAPGTASATATPGITYISQSDNGKTVTTTMGTEIYLVLYSSYWSTPLAAPAGVLAAQPTRTPQNVPSPTGLCAAHQVPGSGCGLFVYAFRASAPGRTVLSSTRTTCGEAMQCPQSERDFAVTVRVTAG